MRTSVRLFVLISLLTLFHSVALGATKVSDRSGPFNFPSTWTDGAAPVAGDNIVIQGGHGVHGATGTIGNLTVNGTLQYSGLTVTGDVHIGTGASMGSLHGGFQLFLKGSVINNEGSINTQTRINGDAHQTITGPGVWNGGGEFTGAGDKTITNMNVPAGGWAVLSVVNVNGPWTFTGGSANKQSTGIVQGSSRVSFEANGSLTSNESLGNLWTAPITIRARVAVPVNSSISAPIIVADGGELSPSIHQVLDVKGGFWVEPGGEVGGESLRLSGSQIINDGDIHPATLSISRDGDQQVSGDGRWRTALGITFGGAGQKSLMNSMPMEPGSLTIDSTLNLNGHTLTFTGGTFRKNQTGSVAGFGRVIFDSDGSLTSNESLGNLWTAPITIRARRAVDASSSISAPIVVADGGELSPNIHQILDLKGGLWVEPGGQVGGESVRLFGSHIINEGDIHPVALSFNRAGDQAISGGGLWRSTNTTTIGGSGVKSLSSSISMNVGGLAIDSALDINEHTLTFNAGTFRKNQTGSVTGTGKILFKGNGVLLSDESTGNLFTAPVEINTGTRAVTTSSGISAPITVENGATISMSINQTLNAKNDLTLKTGSSVIGQTLTFSGVNFVNDGTVDPTNVLVSREGDQTISGSGAWTSPIELRGVGVKSLTSDVTMQTGVLNINAILDLGGHTLTFINGNFHKNLPGSVTGTGLIRFSGNGALRSLTGDGNLFTVPIEIVSGTRGTTSTSSFDGPITVKSGATLSTSANVTLNAKGDLTVENGATVSSLLSFFGQNFVNNGTVAPSTTFFKSGSHVLSGTGTFGILADMEAGSVTVLHGTQQFQTLTLRSGSSFDISNSTIKIGTNFNNSGTVTTDGSTIEYNRGNGDQTLLTNIAYHNLVINNPQQVFLNSAETVQNMLRLERGIFEISTNRLTIGNCGQIIRTGGSLNGTPIVGSCVHVSYEGNTPVTTGTELPSMVTSLTIQNPLGVTLNKNTTVTSSLNLLSDLTTNDFTVTMLPAAVSTGTGDVIGNVRRTGLVNGVVYSFGNPLNSIRFDSGVPPAEITMSLAKSAPADLPDAIWSFYIDETFSPDFEATLRLRYEDTDLNGNNESQLHFFHSSGSWVPVLATRRDEVNNWVETSGVTSFSPWTLAEYTPPQAQTFEVTNINDSGPGSLRQAISDANANPGNDTINLQGLSGVITLTSGALQISESVTVNGPGAHQLTVSGGNTNRVFEISRQNNNESPFVVDINNLTLAQGYATECGGGIYGSNVELSLNHVAVSENTSVNGAGICQAGGSLWITNSTVDNNKANSGVGGGIRTENASLNVINSTVSQNEANSGGGLSLNVGTANIINSTVSHNTAAIGGGIQNEGTAHLRNTIVAGNQATDISGVFNSLGNNLIGTSESHQGFTDRVNGDKAGTAASPIDPKLGDLQNNGGPTRTRAMLSGSPAAETGNSCVLTHVDEGGCLETPLGNDQRGTGFPRRVGGAVDMGAFESSDRDGDGIVDASDNCPDNSNPEQSDNDRDGIGDVCDSDDDNDTISDTADNCPWSANGNQADNDGDAIGDVCDPDDDNDGVADATDNCPLTVNGSQLDTDGDGTGDACDADDDNDGVLDAADNCPLNPNPQQEDFDEDGIGDACDSQTGPPRRKEQCKDDDWLRFNFPRTFKNQGDCVQFVNTGK